MDYKESLSRKIFIVANVVFLSLVAIVSVSPFVHMLAVSLSANVESMAGRVFLWPVGFTLDAYKYVSQKEEFLHSILVSLERVALGTILQMFIVLITAYPLSKEVKQFKWRTAYIWFFVITMFIGGGLIPYYMVVKMLGLIDKIWVLIIPGCVNVWFIVLLINFFRNIPKELEEASIIDGAGQWAILWRIFIPISKPVLATVLLFSIIGHWNSWFDGLIFLNSPSKYPLQTYLTTLIKKIDFNVISPADIDRLKQIGEKNLRTAQIFIAALPIMSVYPFMQKYFIKGITIGSVKG